jgi:hypothetical protein
MSANDVPAHGFCAGNVAANDLAPFGSADFR